MGVYFITTHPQGLLNEFISSIQQSEPKGKITTWMRSEDRKYFTHTSSQWSKLAWMLPSVQSGKLVFNIIKPGNKNIGTAVYGFYHGHLCETFLNHFDRMFSEAIASALKIPGDILS